MPLFKFNPDTVITPSLTVDGAVVYAFSGEIGVPHVIVGGSMSAEGTALFPVLSVAGRMRGYLSGAFEFGHIQVGGSVLVSTKIDGDISFQRLDVGGFTQIESDVRIPALRASGYSTVGEFIIGDVTTPMVSVVGDIRESLSISGDITIRSMLVSGSIIQQIVREMSGSVQIPHSRVFGHISGEGQPADDEDAVLLYVDSRRLL